MLRIERALVGGTDRKAFQRGHPQIPMPGPFGHRYAGRVAARGPDAPPFEVGQPVLGVHSAPCQDCSLCRQALLKTKSRHRQTINMCPGQTRRSSRACQRGK